MRKRYLIIVAVVSIILAALGGWLHFRHQVEEPQSKFAVKNVSAQNGKNSTPPKIDQQTQAGLQMLVSTMKNMGWKEIPPIQQQIQSAIDSKDTGAVIRAFHDAVYAPSSRMAQAIPALQSFLTDPDPWVRFQAAEDLYIAGNNSGEGALQALLQTDHPVRDYDGSDIRTHAAETLIKYRDKKSIYALMDFDRTPRNDWVVTGLAKMMGPKLPGNFIEQIKSYNQASIAIYNLSFVNPSLVKDLAQVTFSKSKDGTQAKGDAAWALLRAGERDPYYSYLTDYAKKAVAGDFPPSSLPDDCYLFSLKILASMKGPETKSLLEDGLKCKNIEIVEIALVNLYFNQGGSDKARQYLLNQFRGPTNLLADSDFDMQLAATINDPQINAAAKSVDDRTGTSRWAYFEDRKNWSVYTWIDDYVVDLNGSRQIP